MGVPNEEVFKQDNLFQKGSLVEFRKNKKNI